SGLADKVVGTDTDFWGTLGSASAAWFRVYSYGYITASDERVKKDIVDLSNSDLKAALERLDSVRSVRFRYKNEGDAGQKRRDRPRIGVIAQSMPEEVVEDDGDVMGIDLAQTLGYTIAALRGLRLEVKELQEEVDRLKRELGRK